MNFESWLGVLAADPKKARALVRVDPSLLQLRSARMQETALHYFAIEGDLGVVELLVDGGTDVDSTNASRQTALMNAAQLNNAEMVQALINAGAGLTLKDENGDTALHVAVESGSMKAAAVLLSVGANPREPNGLGETLSDLVPTKRASELERLLARGARRSSDPRP
jgi:ankyrin repeat protein